MSRSRTEDPLARSVRIKAEKKHRLLKKLGVAKRKRAREEDLLIEKNEPDGESKPISRDLPSSRDESLETAKELFPVEHEFELTAPHGVELSEITRDLDILETDTDDQLINHFSNFFNKKDKYRFQNWSEGITYKVGLVRLPNEGRKPVGDYLEPIKDAGHEFTSIEPLLLLAYQHPEFFKEHPELSNYEGRGVQVYTPGFIAFENKPESQTYKREGPCHAVPQLRSTAAQDQDNDWKYIRGKVNDRLLLDTSYMTVKHPGPTIDYCMVKTGERKWL